MIRLDFAEEGVCRSRILYYVLADGQLLKLIMPSTNIRLSYIVFLLYLLMSIQPIRGLEEPLTLCETQSPVTVRDRSGGTIQHVQRTAGEPADECQLVLVGFSSSAYVSLPGVERRSNIDPCSGDTPEIFINGDSHCINDSFEGVIIALTDGRLTLKIKNITKSFTLDYYSNVAVCDGEDSSILIPSNAAHDQLSCIIKSKGIGTQTCSTTIGNLKGRTIKLELLYITSVTGEAATFTDLELTKANPIILSDPGEEFVITFEQVESALFRYVIKLTVLTCEDAPQVQNASSDASPGPWFSDSQANYTCSEEGYEFRDASSVTCQLDSTNGSLEWSDASDIMCIPVLTCKDAPQVQNASSDASPGPWFSGSQVNYICNEEGYEFRDASSVTCQLDSTNQRLEWSDSSDIICIQVECRVADIKGYISNVNVTQEGRYYYLDTLRYVCDEGYVKSGSVICREDGSWSADPQCVTEKQTGESKSTEPPLNILGESKLTEPPLNIALIAGSTGGGALIVIIIVLVIVMCLRRRPSRSQSTTEINKEAAVANTTEQSVDNPYFELEPPDVIKVPTARSTTKQYEDVPAGPYDAVVLESAETTRKPTAAKKPRVKGNKPRAKKGKLTANATARHPVNTDVYAEINSMKPTHHQPPPSLFESSEPVYDDAPAVPVKLERFGASSAQPKAEEVIMVDNGLYEAAGGRYGSAY